MKNQNQRINILARSYCCLLTSVHYSAFVELWYRMVLHFCHFFLRFPISLLAMSLSQAGSSDRMHQATEGVQGQGVGVKFQNLMRQKNGSTTEMWMR